MDFYKNFVSWFEIIRNKASPWSTLARKDSHSCDLGSIPDWGLADWEWDDNALMAFLRKPPCRTCKNEQTSDKSQEYIWKPRLKQTNKDFLLKSIDMWKCLSRHRHDMAWCWSESCCLFCYIARFMLSLYYNFSLPNLQLVFLVRWSNVVSILQLPCYVTIYVP